MPKTKKKSTVRRHRNVINKGRGVGIKGKVNTIGISLKSRMIRVDAGLADFLAAEAKRGGCSITEASRQLHESLK